MASSNKQKTTMAKRARENKLRERRLDKQAKKEARKLESSEQVDSPYSALGAANLEETRPAPEEVALDLPQTPVPGGRPPAQEPATKAIEDLRT